MAWKASWSHRTGEDAKIDFFIVVFLIQFYRPIQDYLTHIETSQLVGGAKREYPGKTTWHTRKQNLACLTCGQCGHSGEMIE